MATTISRDFADGSSARETAALQALASKSTDANRGLSASSVAAAASQVQRGPTRPPSLPAEARKQRATRNNVDGPLHEYAEQLVILEQRSRGRLLEARLEARGEPSQPDIQSGLLRSNMTSQPFTKIGTASSPDMEPYAPGLKGQRSVNDDNRLGDVHVHDSESAETKETETGVLAHGPPVSDL